MAAQPGHGVVELLVGERWLVERVLVAWQVPARVGEYRDSASACQARVSRVSEEERNDVDDLDCFVGRGDGEEADDQRIETQGVLEILHHRDVPSQSRRAVGMWADEAWRPGQS